jgi:hypothetical protein
MVQANLTEFGTSAETPDRAEENTEDETRLEDLTNEAHEVVEHDRVDVEHLTERLTGRNGLRTSKPSANDDTGLEQYIWRKARFYSGADDSKPIKCYWELSDWLDDQGIDAEVSGIKDDAGEEIIEILDAVARLCLVELGHNPNRGLRRWKRVLSGV